jgi:hypothetical protein
MKRRFLLAVIAGLALGVSACSALPYPAGQPSYKVSAEQLQEALARRFPLRYSAGGLMDFNVQAPVLRFLPDVNRLGSQMVVQAQGPALRRQYTGAFDLDFGLRYEPSDQSIRAHQLQVHSLRLSGLPPQYNELLDAYGPRLAEQALGEIVLHRLRPQDLALADGMGLEPGSITVTSQGLVIGFIAKQLR